MSKSLRRNSAEEPELPDLRQLQQLPGLITFIYSPKKRAILTAIGDTQNILGATRRKLSSDANLFLRYVHADDRFLLFEKFESALKGEDYEVRYRWIRPDNKQVISIYCCARLDRESGQLIGFLHQISSDHDFSLDPELKSLALLANSLPEPQILLGVDGTVQSLHLKSAELPLEAFKIDSSKLTPEVDFLKICNHEEIRNALYALRKGHAPQRAVYDAFPGKSHLRLELVPLTKEKEITGAALRFWDVTTAPFSDRLRELRRENTQYRRGVYECVHHINNTLHAITTHSHLFAQKAGKPYERTASIIDELATHAAELSAGLGDNRDFAEQKLLVNLNAALLRALEEPQLARDDVSLSVKFGLINSVYAIEHELVSAMTALLHELVLAAPEDARLQVKTTQYGDTVVCHLQIKFSRHISTRNIPALFLSESLTSIAEETLMKLLKRFEASIQKKLINNHETCWEITFQALNSLHHMKKPEAIHEDQPTLLLVDDDSIILSTLETIFERNGIQVLKAQSVSEALELAGQYAGSLSAVILDAVLPDRSGASLVSALKRSMPDTAILGFSGASRKTAETLLQAGADRLLYKPMSPRELLKEIRPFLKSGSEQNGRQNTSNS